MILKTGKHYSFKTFSFYYRGEVVECYPTHAILKNAFEVFETGPNVDYYAGKVKYEEPIPDGTMVPLGAGVVIMPFERIVLA